MAPPRPLRQAEGAQPQSRDARDWSVPGAQERWAGRVPCPAPARRVLHAPPPCPGPASPCSAPFPPQRLFSTHEHARIFLIAKYPRQTPHTGHPLSLGAASPLRLVPQMGHCHPGTPANLPASVKTGVPRLSSSPAPQTGALRSAAVKAHLSAAPPPGCLMGAEAWQATQPTFGVAHPRPRVGVGPGHSPSSQAGPWPPRRPHPGSALPVLCAAPACHTSAGAARPPVAPPSQVSPRPPALGHTHPAPAWLYLARTSYGDPADQVWQCTYQPQPWGRPPNAQASVQCPHTDQHLRTRMCADNCAATAPNHRLSRARDAPSGWKRGAAASPRPPGGGDGVQSS